MKRLYWIVAGIVIGVILTIVFIPGVGEFIEGRVLGLVSGWAS